MKLSFTQSKEKDQLLISIEMSLKAPLSVTPGVTELLNRSKLTLISFDAPVVQEILCLIVLQVLEQSFPQRTSSNSELLLWSAIRRITGSV